MRTEPALAVALAVALGMLALMSCDKRPTDVDAAAKKSARPGYVLDERSREETRTRPHVSGRAELAELPFVVKVSGAPRAIAADVEVGFCEALTDALGNRCSGPRKAKVRLWVSEVDIRLRAIAGSIVVDLIGEALLNEGWETADLRLRYGVEGDDPEGGAAARSLGTTLGRTWATELRTYLRKMATERKPSTNVQWVAAPGFMREDTWPLDYGFAEIVAGRTWTFQRGSKTGQRLGYLIDAEGAVMLSESFQTTAAEGKLAGWGTVADEGRRALVMSLPMTAADKKAVNEDLEGDAYAIVVLTRGGEARMVARDSGQPVSPPLILGSGDVVLVVREADRLSVQRVDGVSGTRRHYALPAAAAKASPFGLLRNARDQLFVIPTPPGQEVYTIDALAAPTKPGVTTPTGRGTARAFYRFKSPRTKGSTARRERPTAAVVGDSGALALLDGPHLVVIEADGTERFRRAVGEGRSELTSVGDRLAVMGDAGLLLIAAASGETVGSDGREVSAFVAADRPQRPGYVACAAPGLVAYDPQLVATHAVRLDDRCEDLHVYPDGDVLAARFLWGARLDPPSKWPEVVTAAEEGR